MSPNHLQHCQWWQKFWSLAVWFVVGTYKMKALWVQNPQQQLVSLQRRLCWSEKEVERKRKNLYSQIWSGPPFEGKFQLIYSIRWKVWMRELPLADYRASFLSKIPFGSKFVYFKLFLGLANPANLVKLIRNILSIPSSPNLAPMAQGKRSICQQKSTEIHLWPML